MLFWKLITKAAKLANFWSPPLPAAGDLSQVLMEGVDIYERKAFWRGRMAGQILPKRPLKYTVVLSFMLEILAILINMWIGL